MDEFWSSDDAPCSMQLSELNPNEKLQFIEDHIRRRSGFLNDEDTSYRISLRYRLLRAMAEAAFDYAVSRGETSEAYEYLLVQIFDLESRLRVALRPSGNFDENFHYWQHQSDLQRQVREGKERTIWREDVEEVASDYLSLPFRVPDFERLLVDVLIATEMFAYFSEAFGKNAKRANIWGFTSPSSLLRPHPLWVYFKGLFTELIFLAVLGTIVGYAASLWSIDAAAWVAVACIGIYLLSIALMTALLPFSWRNHVKIIAKIKELIQLMNFTYNELSGSTAISTLRVREVAARAANAGVVWPNPLFAILDDNIRRDGNLPPPFF